MSSSSHFRESAGKPAAMFSHKRKSSQETLSDREGISSGHQPVQRKDETFIRFSDPEKAAGPSVLPLSHNSVRTRPAKSRPGPCVSRESEVELGQHHQRLDGNKTQATHSESAHPRRTSPHSRSLRTDGPMKKLDSLPMSVCLRGVKCVLWSLSLFSLSGGSSTTSGSHVLSALWWRGHCDRPLLRVLRCSRGRRRFRG